MAVQWRKFLKPLIVLGTSITTGQKIVCSRDPSFLITISSNWVLHYMLTFHISITVNIYAEKLNHRYQPIPKCHYAFVGGTCHIYLIKTCMYQKPFLSGNAFVRVFYASALSIILLHMINDILTGIGFIMSKQICVLTCRKICDMFEWCVVC